jgi:hypothetical protein
MLKQGRARQKACPASHPGCEPRHRLKAGNDNDSTCNIFNSNNSSRKHTGSYRTDSLPVSINSSHQARSNHTSD